LVPFGSFLPSLLHSHHALLLHHRWRINKFSNFKIYRHIHSHCQTKVRPSTFFEQKISKRFSAAACSTKKS